ncbi:MAG: hypothetical protein IJP99_09440 [Methanobrevibacter sp.]|nr:hypothetical protein [Methanobrevibacter sp.]
MKNLHKIVILAAVLLIIVGGAYAFFGNSQDSGEGISYNATALGEKLTINMNNWNYDETNDIYYQTGLIYCAEPEDTAYESCGIYVPGKYFDASKNGNGTYSCTVNDNQKVGNYTASKAPVVMPINTAGYSAQKAPTSFNANEVKQFTDEGIIYLEAGCRGRANGDNYTGGAPWGATDLKAAISYYKFNNDLLPGDIDKIFTFGMSGGGAQSAVVGASGNSKLYNPYLESIGAAMVGKNGMTISNAVAGSMCWVPITNLDTADEAYEWNMGQFSSSSTRSDNTFTASLSDDLAVEYAKYINELGLKDPNGNALTLKESTDGIYTSGSYYDYLLQITEESLNNFLNDTTFPYTPGQSAMGGGPSGAMGGGEMPSSDSGSLPGGDAQNATPSTDGGSPPSGDAQSGTPSMDAGSMPGGEVSASASSDNTTYQTPQDYIDSLNSNGTWVEYDAATKTAKIKSLGDFVKHCKNPSKSVGAFDDFNRSQAENDLFGTLSNDSLHFDSIMAKLLSDNADKYSKFSDYNSDYPNQYNSDIKINDTLNNTMQTRENMYNPMYYLCDYYDGAGSSDVAKYWRINSGIEQGDTSQCVEVNLYLALVQKLGKDNVEFNTVWGQGHSSAERTGDSTTNFIKWVNECSK